MHTTNYTNTLITPAADCPASRPLVPGKPGSIAALQYAMLASGPFTWTSDEVIWSVTATRRGGDPADSAARAAFFAKPQACLRASPLVKTQGWALLYDAEGRVALIDPASAAYQAALADPGVTKRAGMRNARG
jgi:hypothetical protein